MAKPSSLPISSVNHISLLCSSVANSVAFYEDVLGFFPIKRPGSFDFDGAWLFNYGMGIHLIQAPNPTLLPKKSDINPKDNHMSFQTGCQDMGEVEERLRELGVRYIRVEVEEGGIRVDQIFFHDPDGFMIEVCTCENLPLVPLNSPAPAAPHNSPLCASPAAAACISSNCSHHHSNHNDNNVVQQLHSSSNGSCNGFNCALQLQLSANSCSRATSSANLQQLAGATSL